MFNIKTLNKISPVGLNALDDELFHVSDAVENPDGILVRSANMHEYEFGDKLRCIARAGAGTNNIPLDRCAEAGIVVFNSPGANSEAVKELVICAMLMSSRDVIGGIEWVKGLAGDPEITAKVEKGKSAFIGPEIFGKTLGVIGLGAIGAKVANAAVELGLKVLGYDPYLSVDAAWGLRRSVQHATNLETIYKNCDYITLHIPMTADTKGMINAEAISHMKDGVRIINLARGELVNDDDMLEALDKCKVACYVTDFPNVKMAGAHNVIATPHIGASTPESEDNCAMMAAREMSEYLINGNIINSVNMPQVQMERSGVQRICVIHRNIPNILSGIMSIFGAEGINVENMMNKSRGDYAYTILDLGSKASEEIVEQIRSNKDILRVRVLDR